MIDKIEPLYAGVGLSALTLAVSLAAAGGEFYEDFHDAPNLSEGWTYGETNNVKLEYYDKAGSLDDKTALGADSRSLKIIKGNKSDDVVAEVLSPLSEDSLRQYSFFCKSNGSGENGDRVRVCGRVDDASDWQVLTDFAVGGYSKNWVTNDISEYADIRQLKFSVSAPASSYKALSLDSLFASTSARSPSGGDDPVTPPEPTKPTKLKLEATAPDAVEATWEGAPGEGGYRVELFRVKDTRETEVPDFSELNAGIWPSGWSHSNDNGFGSYSDGATCNVKISYADAWIASPRYPEPVTSFSFKFRSNSSNAGERDRTRIVIETSSAESGDDWKVSERQDLLETMTTVTREVDYKENVRRIRFSIAYDGDDRQYENNLLLEFRVLSVTCGSKEDVLEESSVTNVKEVVFGGLNAAASYFVTVRPEPSSDPALVAASDVVDLSAEHFRQTGAVEVARKKLTYAERFDSLSNFVTQTRTDKMHLDYWQFGMDGSALDRIGLSQTNTTPQNAGCYVCRDKARIDDLASAMIGTVATKEHECAFGLAMKNGSDGTLPGLTVTFDSVQRSFKSATASYVFEWLVTDGETSVFAPGEWSHVDIPATAPYTSETQGERTEYRQADVRVSIPKKIRTGKTIVLRWRHPKTTSGPMMAIDNVRIAFDKPSGNFVSVK